MKKFDTIKTIGIAGTILGIASTIISSWSQQKDMEKTIEEKVNKMFLEEESE